MRWPKRTADPHAGDPGTEYLEALVGKGFWETKKAKLLKTISVSALSSAGGAVLAGPVGALARAAAPTAIDVTLDLIDEFVLGALLGGWKPRNYFDNVLPPKD